MSTLGGLYRRQGKLDQAERLLSECYRKSREVLGEENPGTQATLGVVYLLQGQYDKAEPLLLEILELYQVVMSEGHPNTVAAINELIKLYDAWEKPQQAEQWRTKLTSKKGTEEQ